jgi:hypothetical protein
MMARLVKTGLITLALGLVMLGLAVPSMAGPTVVLLQVNQAEVAWADPDLSGKLERRLTTEVGLEVKSVNDHNGLPPIPVSHYYTDSLTNWGQEAGARYLMLVTVKSERLERKKTFNLPLIFHKYETVGVIEGEVRFYDVARSRLLISRPIDFELEAKRVFQGSLDGDKNDPSIHLSAVEKLSFFDKMEEKLAEQLVDRIKKVMKKS